MALSNWPNRCRKSGCLAPVSIRVDGVFLGRQQLGQILYREGSIFPLRHCNRHNGYDFVSANAHRGRWGNLNWHSTSCNVLSWGWVQVVNSTTTCHGNHWWNCSVVVTLRIWRFCKALCSRQESVDFWHWTSCYWIFLCGQVRQSLVDWSGKSWGWYRCGGLLGHQWHKITIWCFRLHGVLGSV